MPPLVGGGGGLVCESVGKADLLSDNFYSKQPMESVDLQLTIAILLQILSLLPSGRVRLVVLYLTWTPVGELSICSDLFVLEVLCCLC